jgi:hypothetical protein
MLLENFAHPMIQKNFLVGFMLLENFVGFIRVVVEAASFL